MPDLEELLSQFDPERQERLRQLIARRKQFTPQQVNPNIAWQSHVQPQQEPRQVTIGPLQENPDPVRRFFEQRAPEWLNKAMPAFQGNTPLEQMMISSPQYGRSIGGALSGGAEAAFSFALPGKPVKKAAEILPKVPKNPYLKMPIERVRQDAEKGVNLAKEALAVREGKAILKPSEPIGKVPEPILTEDMQLRLKGMGVSQSAMDKMTPSQAWTKIQGSQIGEGEAAELTAWSKAQDLRRNKLPEPEKVTRGELVEPTPEVTKLSVTETNIESRIRKASRQIRETPGISEQEAERQIKIETQRIRAAIPKAEVGMPVTETKPTVAQPSALKPVVEEAPPVEPPKIPPPPKAPMTPDDADRILSDFGKALKSPQTKQAFQLQEELRSAERGVRQQKFKEILDTEVAKGTTFEEALNKATVSFGGELPKMKSGIVLPESIKEAAYAKIVRVIRNTPDLPNKEYEIASTRKAFDDALAGVKAISAKPGTAGGSALSRLQRVFSDNKELMDILKDPESYAMKMAKSPTELDQNLLKYLRELPPDKTNQLSLIEPTRRMKLIENIQKVGVNVIDVLNLPRAFITAYDLSAPLRQALVLGTRYPKLWGSEFKPMIKALFSEDFGMAVDKQIRNNPIIADGMGRYGLDLPSLSKNVAMRYREESFMSRFAERIPGVRASQRAYLTFLNKFRADVWTKNVDILKKVGATDNDYKEFAQFINWSTGRGSLPKPLVGSAPALNALLFSPRLVFSRLELPAKLVSSSPYVRKEAAKTLVTFLGFGASILGLVKLAGGYVEFDPRSSEFAKVRVGNTRLDIWGGYVQYARFISQLTSGQRKTTEGFEEELDRWTTIQRFLQSKQSPGMGLFVDIMRGETYAGEEMSTESESLKQQAYNRLVPLFVQDVIDAIKEEGLPTGLVGLPSGLGVGVVTYKENARLIAPNRGSLEGMVSELKRLDKKVGYAGAEIAGETLTTEQKKIYQEATTAEISKALNQLFTSDSYNKANDVNRKYMTDETVASARLRARESLVPTLPSKAQMRYKITQNGGSIAQFEKTLGRKWDDPKSEAIIRTADKYLTPYYRIESDVWNQTGTIPGTNIQYKAASDAWEKLAKKDAQKAKEVLFNSPYGPTILAAKKEILLKQRDMKLQSSMLRAIWKLFY